MNIQRHRLEILIIGISSSCPKLMTGAGLGGLAAAIKIALVGHKVKILEAAPEIREVAENSTKS